MFPNGLWTIWCCTGSTDPDKNFVEKAKAGEETLRPCFILTRRIFASECGRGVKFRRHGPLLPRLQCQDR